MSIVADIGERTLIKRIMKHLTIMPEMIVPFWDDVSAVSISDGRAVVLKTDMLVWSTDVPKGMSFFQAARKAVVMNFSDIGSKGVQPLAFLASLGIPRDLPVTSVEEMAKGFQAGTREYQGFMIGGDTNEACDVIIAGMAYGIADEDKIITRRGAQEGELVATTGNFGNTAAAFKILFEEATAPKDLKQTLLNSVFTPHAKINAGIVLAESGFATSSIDSSDGLAKSLYDLSESSKVGFRINQVPISREALKFAEINDLNESELALYGGEEYELIFTILPEKLKSARKALIEVGCKLHIIGEVVDSGISFLEKGTVKPIEPKGWEHFK
jgi:thiamine-monophosphate kinase